jgi:uncharacterized protein (DUF302 family)
MNSDFGFGKVVDASFDDAIDKVTAELEKEGFGVLSDIDVAAKMKAKLDKDMPRYRILGACNPALAYQAISAVEDIGLLLPCNVLVREDSNDKVHVDFMDPKPPATRARNTLETGLPAFVRSARLTFGAGLGDGQAPAVGVA